MDRSRLTSRVWRARRTAIVIIVATATSVGGFALAPAAAEDPSWNVVDSANTSPDEHNRLQDVDCAGVDDCWAAGFTTVCTEVGICNQHKTLIEHWDGASWTIVDSPNPSPHANQLWDIECIRADDCWTVGNYTGVGGRWTLIEHWDGTSWSIVPSPNPVAPLVDGWLTGVTCVAADDCWAVGGGADSLDGQVNNHTLIEHWDGTTWSIVPTPNISSSVSHFLNSVTCAGLDDCWAVGYSLDEDGHYKTLVMHWDGNDWSIVDSPNPSPTPRRLTGDRLSDVTCTSADDCWAVGVSPQRGNVNPSLILRWDGTSWATVPSPEGGNELNGVTCTSADACWAVGGTGPISGVGLQILAWDGTSWLIVPSPGGGDALNGVTCVGSGDCWSVGEHHPFPPGPRVSIHQTLILGTIDVDRGEGEHVQSEPSGDEAWVTRYNGPADQLDAANAAGVSPDGSQVFVTGESRGADRREDFATVAYDAAGGSALWLARYNGPTGYGFDRASGLAVSPDGSRVFVTGESVALFGDGEDAGYDFATVAYDTADGRELWVARYNGPGNGGDHSNALSVSPDGSRVFVTGGSAGVDTGLFDFATVAYDAADGTELWVARSDGPAGGNDSALSLGVSADGGSVYVGGYSQGVGTGLFDFATVAYDTADGSELWATRYNGPANGYDVGRDLEVSPDGSRVFVTGESNSGASPIASQGRDFASVAYDGANGTELWVGRFDGPDGNNDNPRALDVSPDGSKVVVVGGSSREDPTGAVTDRDLAAVAYDAASGNELWAALYSGLDGGLDFGNAVSVTPDGSRAFVTGLSDGEGTGRDFVTIRYDAGDGSEEWTARYDGPGSGNDDPQALEVSPDGSRVFVTGRSQAEDRGLPGHDDFATVAYDAGSEPSPSPTATNSPTPSPSESPQPEMTEVSFTERSAASGQYTDRALFEARLTDSTGDPIADAALTFVLAGEGSARSFEATTDDDGVASVSATLTETPGSYDVTARYDGDSAYAADSTTTSFEVTREDTDVELNVKGKGNDKTLEARLSDRDAPSFGIEGRAIEFYSETELIGSARTDANGVATLPVPPGHRGSNRSYEALFPGDDFFVASSGSRSRSGGGSAESDQQQRAPLLVL